MNLRPTLREKGEPHTSALNDILFILLFFFLIIATLANPNVIRMAIPKANKDTKAKQTVVVSINAGNQYFVGTRQVAPEALQGAIAEMLAKSPDAEKTVVINADSTGAIYNLAAVLRATQALKVKAVMAVNKEK
ncbi:ExbD/TolR family protein [Taibaiella koreensis]|uniref:ExbD/TolR family protein n=1 Tax=Taibaiella koreensis TaxID=1268548 RepID=UPI000E59E167|nr:biopolymer transporter ExbD [Taibaiella koreensis]